MPFKDIDIFLLAAQAIFQGLDPYSIQGVEVFYPLPFYFLFIPLTVLPVQAVHVVWTALQMVILVAILRRRALWVALSMPVFLTFLLGQVDIVMLGLFTLLRSGVAGGIALAFMVLKPQLVLLLAPWMLWTWWRRDRRQIAWFALVLGVIVVSSFIVQPDWLARFVARSGERTRANISSSLWGLLSFLPTPMWFAAAGLLALVLVVWAWRKNDFDLVAAVGLLVSPYIFSYNLLPLLAMIRKPIALLAWTVLSWVAFAAAALEISDRASALLTIAVLIALFVRSERANLRLRSAPTSEGQGMVA
ncbi:MAG: DUF2029 domain-containing protein [Chloroflexi bacterium]|nr:DUF2029 domain-containing protein [Chloroflexota bacterium]